VVIFLIGNFIHQSLSPTSSPLVRQEEPLGHFLL